MATNGNDYITWNPADGSILIDGLGDQFDSNLYQPYDLDVGMTTGDMLRVESNQGVFIRFDTWHDGWINQGGSRADFVNVERIYGSSGNDVVRAGQVTQSGPDGHGISIFSGAGNDNIVASRFGDVIDAGSGNDTIFAGMGDDFINSSEGNDLIYGGQVHRTVSNHTMDGNDCALNLTAPSVTDSVPNVDQVRTRTAENRIVAGVMIKR